MTSLAVTTIQELHRATEKTPQWLWRKLRSVPPISIDSAGNSPGRPAKTYLISNLPGDLRLSVMSFRRNHEPVSPDLDGPQPGSDVPATLNEKGGQNLPSESERKKALAAADLLRAYRANYEKTAKRKGRGKRKKDFVDAYNAGSYGTYPRLYQILGSASVQTLDRWDSELKVKGDDPLALVDLRGKHRKGNHLLTKRQQEILLNSALNPSSPPKSEVIRIALARMEAEGIPSLLQDRQLRRILDHDEATRKNIWVGAREGQKAHNEKCLPHARRDWNLVEVGQILIADGHTLNFDILCPDTGRPKRMTLLGWYDGRSNMLLGWEIMPSENTACISAALRRALIALGKWPLTGIVAYLDNGKAFKSRFFMGVDDFNQEQLVGLYERLGIKVITALPYHAKSKPIERFFGTLAELERRVHASYVGTSIEKKPPRLKRGEFIHKSLHERFFNGYVPNIWEAHQLIAGWLDEYANRPQQGGHLRGEKPIDVFNSGKGPGLSPEQEAELRLLMMPFTVRKIKPSGITLPGRPDDFYYDPALFGRTHPVLVRHDFHPGSSVFVYHVDGKFICEARLKEPLHPAAAILGSEEDKAGVKAHNEQIRSLEKRTFGPAKQLLNNTILPEMQEQLESFGIQSKEQSIKRNMAKTARARVIDAVEPEPDCSFSPEEEATFFSELEEAQRRQDQANQKNLEDAARYERIIELEAKNFPVSQEERCWQSAYQRSAPFKMRREYFEDLRLKLVCRFMNLT